MTIRHHPSNETLARFAAGTLEAGPVLVVATHLDACSSCRIAVANFEAVGGALLDELPSTPLAPEALAMTLAGIDAPHPAPSPRLFPAVAPLPDGIKLPRTLSSYNRTRWRWLAPGIKGSRIEIPGNETANVMLYRIGAKRKLPEHGHTGAEFTHLISGSFSDGANRYLPGDFAEADASVDHQPVVDPDGECICLAAVVGEMRLHSFIGRLLQPMIKF